MENRSWLYRGVCLLVGLAIGYFYAEGRSGRVATNTFATLQMMDLGDSSHRALQAYQHETAPVAICSLSEFLDKLKTADLDGEAAFLSHGMLSIDMMLTHARLAKLYEQMGQTNLSEQHFIAALDCAKADNKLTITNKEVLMDFVTKLDQMGNRENASP